MTEAEQVFLKRMLPHVIAGKSFEDAARSVLADDERIFAAFCDRGTSHYVPTADERGSAYYTGERVGDLIAAEITKAVYNRLRSKI